MMQLCVNEACLHMHQFFNQGCRNYAFCLFVFFFQEIMHYFLANYVPKIPNHATCAILHNILSKHF